MTDHHWSELAAAFALGALDPAERIEFERHLETCASCRAEVQSFREVAGRLAYTAPASTPSPALKDRVLRTAREVRPIAARRRGVLPWAAAAAAAIAVVAGYGYWRARAEYRA